jgi:hypothetical protein
MRSGMTPRDLPGLGGVRGSIKVKDSGLSTLGIGSSVA